MHFLLQFWINMWIFMWQEGSWNLWVVVFLNQECLPKQLKSSFKEFNFYFRFMWRILNYKFVWRILKHLSICPRPSALLHVPSVWCQFSIFRQLSSSFKWSWKYVLREMQHIIEKDFFSVLIIWVNNILWKNYWSSNQIIKKS